MCNNLLVIEYYLAETFHDLTDSETEEISIVSEETFPIALNWKLQNSLKAFVKNDIETIIELCRDLFCDEPHRLMIYNSLQSMHSVIIDNTYLVLISSIPVPNCVTEEDVARETEGIFTGWYDSDPLRIELDGRKYKVCPGVSLTKPYNIK